MSKTKKVQEPTFTEARARLDEILSEVEADDIDVDVLAARVKEASALIRLCRAKLTAARREVSKVVADLQDEAPGDEDEGRAPTTAGADDRVPAPTDAEAEAGAADGDDEDSAPPDGLPF